MTIESDHALVKELINSMPEFASNGVALNDSELLWLNRARVLVERVIGRNAGLSFGSHAGSLDIATRSRESHRRNIRAVLFRVFATTEATVDPSMQGAFIPANNVFDALAVLSTLFNRATRSLLIVDPYMDEKALTDFVVLAPEQVQIQLLAAVASVKPSLRPAVQRWQAQYVSVRRIDARLAPTRSLHDRLLIVDGSDVWILTQSLNALATRAPASVVKSDAQSAALKVAAYAEIWNSASAL